MTKNIDRSVPFLYCLSSNTRFARLQRLGQYHYFDHLQKGEAIKMIMKCLEHKPSIPIYSFTSNDIFYLSFFLLENDVMRTVC